MKKYLILLSAFFFYSCGIALKPHQIGQARFVYYSEDKEFVTYRDEIAMANSGKLVVQNATSQETDEADPAEDSVADELASAPEENMPQKKTAPPMLVRKPVTSLDFPIFLLDLTLIGFNTTLPILALGADYFAHTLYKPIEPISKNSTFKPELTRADRIYLEEKRREKFEEGNKNASKTNEQQQEIRQEQVMF